MNDTTTTQPTDADLEMALNNAVAKEVRKGYTVSSRSQFQVTLERKRGMSVFWNVVLTLLTGGLWLIVVLIRYLNRKPQTRSITIDRAGKVRVR